MILAVNYSVCLIIIYYTTQRIFCHLDSNFSVARLDAVSFVRFTGYIFRLQNYPPLREFSKFSSGKFFVITYFLAYCINMSI